MSMAATEPQPRVSEIDFAEDKLVVAIQDGRIVLASMVWYPRLMHATEVERSDWQVFEDSDGRDVIFWEQIDELIPVVALLAGVPSRESKRSVEHWLATREPAG